MLAFDLVAAYADSVDPFYVKGGVPATLTVAPQQITLRFSPEVRIDPTSLAQNIRVLQGGSPVDVGLSVDDVPSENQVAIRFKETLRDGNYQIVIGAGLRSRGSLVDFVNPTTLNVQLNLGAFVVSVVPQPVTRDPDTGLLSQDLDAIDVYFNADDSLLASSAQNEAFYRLVPVDPDTNADKPGSLTPTSVVYDAATGRASLSFGGALQNTAELYRLEIGAGVANFRVVIAEGSDNNSSFTTALAIGTLGAGGAEINGSIVARPTLQTPVGALEFPVSPGALDTPGHRDVPVDSGSHGIPPFVIVDPVTGMAAVAYNFRPIIGTDPQGNLLQNVITEAQKQRAREIFELFSLRSGVRFIETPDQGLMVATGDLRAFSPNVPAGAVAGLGGGSGALMNSLINWGDSEYGGSWFRVAMHEIGHAIGLSHTYDLPSIMGADLGGEAVFPGDYDFEHLRQLYPSNGSDIDVYRFTIAETGRFTAETVVARPGMPVASRLDTVLSLYREEVVNGRMVHTLVARNDDYYGRDSFLGLDLEVGNYFIAVTSTGNTAFDPVISDSGADGRTDGAYRLDLGFTPESAASNTIVDATGTPLDGDRDGASGGIFQFWFKTALEADTVYVDKASPTPGPGDGSLANPFTTIPDALAAVPTGGIVRIAGIAAAPYQIGTDLLGSPLADGATFNIPAGVTVMIDGGAVFKLRATNIDVGSSSQLVSRASAAIQVLGVPATGTFPGSQVTFTSWHDDSIGGNSDGTGPAVQGGQWGGIVLRQDSDMASKRAFVNSITGAILRYGGGNVAVDQEPELAPFAPIQIESTRPTILFNQIEQSAGAAIAATPNSFEDTGERIGPELRGNRLTGNSINGLFVKIDTQFGTPLDRLDVPARFESTDIVYVIQENLVINGGVGGYSSTVSRLGNLTASDERITGLAKTSDLRVGMQVEIQDPANPGDSALPAGRATIVRIDGPTAITLSAKSLVTAQFATITFRSEPARVDLVGDVTIGSTEVTNLPSTANLVPGMRVEITDEFNPGLGVLLGGFATLVAVIDGTTVELDVPSSISRAGMRVSFIDQTTPLGFARDSGRLTIDPGVVVKLQGSRIELERGIAQLVAEGRPGKPVIFTSLGDNRYGAGGTFDTNGNVPDKFDAVGVAVGTLTVGDWGGLILNGGSKASVDRAYIAFGGGETSIEGGFDNFNVIEVHQGDLRLANSRVEYNAPGTARTLRTGRGSNADSTVFVRGAQPVIVANDFRTNLGAVISVDANSLSDLHRGDVGRSTGVIDRSTRYDDNFGPLVRGNVLQYGTGGQAVAGMVVRGGEITVESVWDDTDIVHVLQDEITVQNFHTATGMRLLSKPDASLVVKLFGASAGFTAAGENLDIEDRIGGTVQFVGQPGYPVILTSLRDDTAGASVDPLGRLVTDTNVDGAATASAAGDWRSLRFLPFSNDRNVTIFIEREKAYTGSVDGNGTISDAEWLGILAPNYATGNNTWESAQEKSGDENRRLGFEVHGNVAYDDAADVDVYTFVGYAGSEVWVDIDKTSSALDTMVELLDAAGVVRARSVDSGAEGGVEQGEVVLDPLGGTSVTYQFAPNGLTAGDFSLVPGTLNGVIYDSALGLPLAIQTFSVDANGTITFQSVLGKDIEGIPNTVPIAGGGSESYATSGFVDLANGRLTLTFSGSGMLASQVEVRYSYRTPALASVTGIGQTLGKESWRGGDFFTQNPRDGGMRVILPGTQGVQTRYYLRVRSQPRYEPAATGIENGGVSATTAAQYRADVSSGVVKNGATSGRYELRVRLRQRDEKPGSTVRYADIRYPSIGIDVQGLPANSPLVADTAENQIDTNDTFAESQYIGNVLESNRGALSVAGTIGAEGDVDWYSFALNYEQLQSIAGVNDGPYGWATVFDIDYADGFRGDLTISVFDESGTLLFVGRDSDVIDDQPGPLQGTDFDDLSKGSAGKLDPFIGTVDLVAGGPTGTGGGDTGLPPTPPDPLTQRRYYVAISSNERLPTELNATFGSAAANAIVRLEPIASIDRIITDRIGAPVDRYPGVAAAERMIDTLALQAHVTPFTLADVTLFVTTSFGNSLVTVDAMRGGIETTIEPNYGTTSTTGDLVMRPDGRLYSYSGLPGVANTAGRLDLVDSGTGVRTIVGNDNIPNLVPPTTPSATEINRPPQQVGAGATSTFQLANRNLQAATLTGTLQYTGIVNGVTVTGTWSFTTNGAGALTFTAVTAPAGLASPQSGTVNVNTGVVSVTWTGPVVMSGVSLVSTTYTYTVPGDPNSVTSDLVDAVAWNWSSTGTNALYYAVRDGVTSRLYRADPLTGSAAAVQGQPWGRIGTGFIQTGGGTLGTTRGMAFVDGVLYGVDNLGNFYSIDTATAAATLIATIAGSPAFSGLSRGPQNLEGGRFQDWLFAITGNGNLYCFDTAGALQTVFDANGDGVAEATTIATGASGVTGLAFSPLDINLWHPTTRRNTDDGGGTSNADRLSMYFGFEEYVAGNPPYGGFATVNGQYGAVSAAWQQDLSSNTAIRNNYNLPGGAYGSLTTNSFSLAGYTYTDKPTLYFDYRLETEGASGTAANNAMRDSARVLASIDGGVTWELLATNNSVLSTELPGFPSVSSRISNDAVVQNQHVQELFETSNWRQARVDLGKFAGFSNIRLRFDFHTAGEFDATQPASADLDGDGVNDDLLNTIVNDTTGRYFQTPGLANVTGDFNSAERGQNNEFEGFYIDDLVIGFAERGEAVTGATAGATTFFDVGTPGPSATVGAQVLNGPYQLEIRRGTERGAVPVPDALLPSPFPETFDTNDRLIGQRSNTTDFGSLLGDANQPREQGQFVIENNIITSAAEYGIRVDAAARDGGSSAPHPGSPRNLPTLNNRRLVPGVVVANNVVAMSGTAGILFSADGRSTAPYTVTYTDEAMDPSTYTVATDNSPGLSVLHEFDPAGGNPGGALKSTYTVTRSPATSLTVLTKSSWTFDPYTQGRIQSLGVSADYQFDSDTNINSSIELVAEQDGFYYLYTAAGPASVASGTWIDITKTAITAQDFQPIAINGAGGGGPGLDFTAAGSRIIFAPAIQWFFNAAAGSTVQYMDNYRLDVVAAFGPSPISPVTFGRIVNNTIYGAPAARGVGIVVSENGGPTVLNNLFANLAQGVQVDGTSSVNTVVAMSAYWETATQVSGVTQSGQIALLSSPFVNPTANNFYLVSGTRAIDSSLNALQDRNEFVQVNSPIGISPSPIIAPDRDLYGQLRGDDPGVTNLTGLGSNVFKDRGAIDRVDFTQPTATLINPLDGGPDDRNQNADHVAVRLAAGAVMTHFELELRDAGVGIDDSTVVSGAFSLARDGVPLVAGVDYVFRYLQSSNRVTFESSAVFVPGAYTITGSSRPSSGTQTGRLTDIANNTLRANQADGTTVFTIQVIGLPTAPRSLNGTAGSGQVALQWLAPANAGGAAVSDYVVEYSPDGVSWIPFSDGVSPATAATVTGLVNGTAYYFRVAAVNEAGQGPFAQTLVPVTPYQPAPAPLSLVAQRGNTLIPLTWVTPVGSPDPITDYRVEWRIKGAVTWTTVADGVGVSTNATVTGLTNGVTYEFRVTTVTQYGPGLSAVVEATPEFAPAPANLAAVRGNTRVSLTWDRPAGTWFGAITDYRVQYRELGTTQWTTVADGVSPVTGAVVSRLTNNVTYEFQVTTITEYGAGLAAIVQAKPEFAPAPVNLAALRGSGVVNLTWSDPPGTWFGTITDYRVQYRKLGTTQWWTFDDGKSPETGATITGLTNGERYQFQVTTITEYGDGLSAIVEATPQLTPAPVNLVAEGDDSLVNLTWNAPPGPWYGTVIDYRVDYRELGGEWLTYDDGFSDATTATVYGLTNGVTYEFRVTTVAEPGGNGLSAVVQGMPVGVPLEPTGVALLGRDRSCIVTWDAVVTGPATGGLPLTGHRVEWSSDNGLSWTGREFGSSPTATVTGLVNNTSYLVRVAARNARGLGPFASASTAVTPRPLAGPPTRLTSRAGNGNVAIAWTAPTNTGGLPIVNYSIQYSTNYSSNPNAAVWTTVTSNSTLARATVIVANGQAYVFRVAAITAGGVGAYSAVSPRVTPFLPTAIPEAPTGFVVTSPVSRRASLSWVAPPANAGGPIAGYIVQYRLANSTKWVSISTTAPSALIQNLSSGRDYVFRVQARNLAGVGVFSESQTLRIA